jgi:hypothetical protein
MSFSCAYGSFESRAYSDAASQFSGASPSPGLLRFSRDSAIQKFSRLRDEDRALEAAFASRNIALATKTFSRLARLRDAFYKKAALAAQGKRAGQVHFRAVASISTAGLSELLRLSRHGKAVVAKHRAQRAAHFKAIGDACSAIFNFWKSKFSSGHSSGTHRIDKQNFVKLMKLSKAGGSEGVPAASGEDISEIVASGSAAVDKTLGPADLDANQGTQEEFEFTGEDLGYMGLGALGTLLASLS